MTSAQVNLIFYLPIAFLELQMHCSLETNIFETAFLMVYENMYGAVFFIRILNLCVKLKLMKGKALRKHSLHEKNSSLGFIEAAVHQ